MIAYETNKQATPSLLVRNEGVLITTDVVWESFYLMLARQPLLLFMVPYWLSRGGGRLADELLRRFLPDIGNLPYQQSLLSYLRRQRQTGRRLVLITARSMPLARQVADHLGLFDEVRALPTGYDLEPAAERQLPDDINTALVSGAAGPLAWSTWARAIRMHQWLKNLLIFVPLITAHQIGDMDLIARAACAFFSFSLCASAIYLFNDLLDLPADRKHQSKSGRPLAAGRLSIRRATSMVPLLLIASFTTGLYAGPPFLAALSGYFILSTLYSCSLKKQVIIDVVILALLYTTRILAGGAAVAIMPSFWLLSFAMFIFFSLALMKRSADLVAGQMNGLDLMEGRGYENSDAPIVQTFGVASGYLAVLVLALYIHSNDVRLLYHRPEIIWLLCPLLFYWISRVWLITSRGQMCDDPVLFAIRDRVSQTVAVLAAIILWAAS